MRRRTIGILALMTAAAISLSACGQTSSTDSASAQTSGTAQAANTSATETSADQSEYFTDRDLEQEYDDSDAAHITLSDGNSSSDSSSGVSIDGDTITISKAGTYVFSGSLSDGQIVVEAGDDDKVEIVFNGVSISNTDSACIYVKTGDKVFVTTADGSENTLTTSSDFVADGDTNVDGVIFSKQDLVLKGEGTLTINSTGNGVVSKDDLKVTGGTVNITASGKGFEANDSIRIAGGTVTIDSEDDSIHVDSSDDAAGYYYQSGGTLTLSSGDDGIHADGETTIDGGTVTISESYEGLEGKDVTINGGTISVTSDDDGINAAGGSDTSDETRQQDFFGSSGDNTVTINGGELTIDANGDGIDSNGDLSINGGTIFCSGQSSGMNSAIDYGEGAEAVINGGTLVATGYSGMSEAFSDSSTQCIALVGISNATDESVTVTDADGNELVSWDPPKEYNCIYVSTPDMEQGETITVTCGSESQEVSLDDIVTTSNVSGSFGGGFGGGAGGGGSRQQGGGSRSGARAT